MPFYRLFSATLIASLLILSACSRQSNSITGQWTAPAYEGGDIGFEFSADGQVIMTSKGHSLSGTYTLEKDNQIQISLQTNGTGQQTFTLTEVNISGNSLSFKINNGDNLYRLIRGQ